MDARTAAAATLGLAGLLAAYVVAGLALQHAAYILQYGSVFETLRRSLSARACAADSPPLVRWFCTKLREMLACQLCTITQLALFFCALPATAVAVWAGGSRPFGLIPGLAVWAYVLFTLGVAFSVAAVGLICWDVARLVGRGTEAVILYLRAKKDAAEAEARIRSVEARIAHTRPLRAAPPSEPTRAA